MHNQIKSTLVCLQHKMRYQYQVNPICLSPLLYCYERKGERMSWRIFSHIRKPDKCQSFTRIQKRHFFLLMQYCDKDTSSVTVKEALGNLLKGSYFRFAPTHSVPVGNLCAFISLKNVPPSRFP